MYNCVVLAEAVLQEHCELTETRGPENYQCEDPVIIIIIIIIIILDVCVYKCLSNTPEALTVSLSRCIGLV